MLGIEADMGLPKLYLQPQNEEQFQAWAFNHAANHYDIVAAGTAKQQVTFTASTNATTLSGNSVMQFAAVPAGIAVGMALSDVTSPAAIPAGAVVGGFNATLVQLSLPAAANINSGNSILFSPGINVVALTQFCLSPVDPNNLGMWLYQHSIMHAQINQVLGTTGYNLIELDWQDPDQFAEWLNQNGDEHQRLCAALGIG